MSWCAICKRVVLKEDPHYRQTKEEQVGGLPCVSFDYKTMGQSDKEDDKITVTHRIEGKESYFDNLP